MNNMPKIRNMVLKNILPTSVHEEKLVKDAANFS